MRTEKRVRSKLVMRAIALLLCLCTVTAIAPINLITTVRAAADDPRIGQPSNGADLMEKPAPTHPPRTGDEPTHIVWIAVFILSGLALAIFTVVECIRRDRKKK